MTDISPTEKHQCPECEVELTEYEDEWFCDICGYKEGETEEERYSREKANRERRKRFVSF